MVGRGGFVLGERAVRGAANHRNKSHCVSLKKNKYGSSVDDPRAAPPAPGCGVHIKPYISIIMLRDERVYFIVHQYDYV